MQAADSPLIHGRVCREKVKVLDAIDIPHLGALASREHHRKRMVAEDDQEVRRHAC